MPTIDMTKLLEFSPRIWRTVRSLVDVPEAGVHEVDLAQLSDYTRRELFDFFARQALTPDIAAPKPKVEPASEPQVDFEEIQREEQRDIKARADTAAARNRLNEYAAVGLEDSQHNFELIKEFVNNSAVHGYWSAEIVDVAVKTLGNRLTWRKPEAAAPPALAVATEVLNTLPDGTTQLPLGATNSQIKTASKAQAADWLARNRAARTPPANVQRTSFNIF